MLCSQYSMDSKYQPKYSPKYSADYCALKMPRCCSAVGLLDCTRSTLEDSLRLWCCAPTIAYAHSRLRPLALTPIPAYAFSQYGGRSLVCRRSPTPTSTTSAGPSRRRCPSMQHCNAATLQHSMQHCNTACNTATQHATFPQTACARATTWKRRARLRLWWCRTATSATRPVQTCNATQRNETTNKQTNDRQCAALRLWRCRTATSSRFRSCAMPTPSWRYVLCY